MKAKLDELIKEFGIYPVMACVLDIEIEFKKKQNIENQNEFLKKINNCIEIIVEEKSLFLDRNYLIDNNTINLDNYFIKLDFSTKQIVINNRKKAFFLVGIDPFILDYFSEKYTTVSDFEIINIPF